MKDTITARLRHHTTSSSKRNLPAFTNTFHQRADKPYSVSCENPHSSILQYTSSYPFGSEQYSGTFTPDAAEELDSNSVLHHSINTEGHYAVHVTHTPPDLTNTDSNPQKGGKQLDGLSESTGHMVWRRLSVLIILLILQSFSQVVLQFYEQLFADHIVIPMFLTMLVGAGGNAGNQAALSSITGIIQNDFGMGDLWRVLRKELIVGFLSAFAMGIFGFTRVFFFYQYEEYKPSPVLVTVSAISISLFSTVLLSVVLGSLLPFLLRRLNINVENAVPVIQVLMDILGVLICCVICSVMLPSPVRR